VIFPGYINQVKHIVELAEKLKIYIKVQPVNQHFYFADAPDQPSEIEFDKIDSRELSELIKYLIKARHVLNSRFYLKNIINYFTRNSYCSLTRPRCLLPYYFLEANPHRIVSPCMFATGWEQGINLEEYIKQNDGFVALQKKLKNCRKCDKSMYICYWETMLNLPITNFIKYNIFQTRT